MPVGHQIVLQENAVAGCAQLAQHGAHAMLSDLNAFRAVMRLQHGMELPHTKILELLGGFYDKLLLIGQYHAFLTSFRPLNRWC